MSAADLAGRVAVVTGAARGLGRTTALALGRAGVKVVLVGRSTRERPNKALPGTLEEVAMELVALGADHLVVAADVSSEEDVARVLAETEARFGGCDLLVNNAAVSFLGDFLAVRPSKWRAAVGVNLFGPVMLLHAFLPGMLERGNGRVLNLSSIAALDDGVVQLPYSVSKLGLERLTTGLAGQLVGTGVAVNCIRIDEVVPTEAVTLAAPHLRDTARCTPEQFAEGAVAVLALPAERTGEVLAMDDLRAAGVLPG
ncbi:SDR family NAD(P)-dependent oxidoreductase [Pseudonocardia sp. NPDC049154]|uniref:SDR family NAD(P)-dependent oxidoreductase n=1 Tax=Pseudonocardia sp. NPDC049154 TaxID=3155501 RepID=UPI0034025998